MATDLPTRRNRQVLLVNPNSNVRTTELMTDIASGILGPEEFDVVGLTASEGPAMIIDPGSLEASARHVRAAVQQHLAGPDGALGDPGRATLAEALEIPVIGIGQASIHSACGHGRRFGMATSTPLLVESLTALVEEQIDPDPLVADDRVRSKRV